MSAANRKRGQRAEVAVVNYLRTQGFEDARRYLSGDGRQPGDIDWHPLVCLEVKDHAQSRWPTWCRQALAEAPAGTVPVVVRRTRGTPDVGQWECRTPMDNLLRFADDAHLLPAAGPDAAWRWWELSFADLVAAVRSLDETT